MYAEQAYLAASLQEQSSKANELLRQYTLLEDELQGMPASRQRRRLRKRLHLVWSQLNRAAEQEKAISVRLGEVYMEVHSRDAWAQVSQQRRASQGAVGQTLPTASADRASPRQGNPRPLRNVDGASTRRRATGTQTASEAGLAVGRDGSPAQDAASASDPGEGDERTKVRSYRHRAAGGWPWARPARCRRATRAATSG